MQRPAQRDRCSSDLLRWAGLQVFLKVDTGFTHSRLDIKAYVSRSMSLGSLQLGTDFLEVELDLQTTDVQKISGAPVLQQARVACAAPLFQVLSIHPA